MRKSWLIALPLLLLLQSCGRPAAPPTDEELTQLFLENEAAFEEIRATVAEFPYGEMYPPLESRTRLKWMHRSGTKLSHEDSLQMNLQLPAQTHKRIRSLLRRIRTDYVYFTGRERQQELMELYHMSPGNEVSFRYYSRGYLTVIRKEIVYAEHIPADELVCDRELNDLYAAFGPAASDTATLSVCKRIKGNWYICFTYLP